VILNATSFAAGTPEDPAANPLAAAQAGDAPVLQVVFAGSTEAQWATGTRGLSATDIAMNVALPEIDGRILSRAVSFKDEDRFDAATQCPVVTYAPSRTASPSWPTWPRPGRGCARRPSPKGASRWCWPTTPTATGGWRTAWASTRRPPRSRRCG
jgi:hypothetical protein